jgi:hypothetical protein
MKVLIITTVLLALGLAVIACAPSDRADAKSPSFYWESWSVDINVQENGDMLVTEVMQYGFTRPTGNQRSRWIPLDKIGRISDVSVTDQGERVPASSGLEDGKFWIRWSHPPVIPPASRTFTLKYRVHAGLRIHDKGDQVYWKALPKERSAPIKRGEVMVRLPDSLAGKVMKINSFGVPADSSQLDSRTVRFVPRVEVRPKKELEVQVTFEHGIIAVGSERR